MSRRRSILEESGDDEQIDMSPLIDMVFILLIFFIVTTVFVEETGVEVNKPQAANAVDLQKNSILIAITDGGEVVYGGKNIGVAGVRTVVRQLVQKEQVPVIIQADKKASVDLYARVYDECKFAGAEVVNMSTAN